MALHTLTRPITRRNAVLAGAAALAACVPAPAIASLAASGGASRRLQMDLGPSDIEAPGRAGSAVARHRAAHAAYLFALAVLDEDASSTAAEAEESAWDALFDAVPESMADHALLAGHLLAMLRRGYTIEEECLERLFISMGGRA